MLKKNSWRLRVLVLVFMSGVLTGLAAEKEADPSLLTLDRIFDSDEFNLERFGPARWLRTFPGYTTLEPAETVKEAQDIVRYHAAAGERDVLVAAGRLIPPGLEKPLTIEDYDWSPDGQWLLIFTNSRRVWRQNTRGDYWVLHLTKGDLHQLGGDKADPSSLMFARFSPDSSRVAYVRQRNIFVEHLPTGNIVQLTRDGSDTIINGTTDWAYEEEFFLRDAYRWSPDSQWVAYWQFDTEGVRDFYLINNTDDLYSRIIPLQYPKAGETNSACRLGVARADGGQTGDTLWFEPPGDPRSHYIPRMDWAANSEEILIQRMNRLQNENRLMIADIHSRSLSTILIEKDEAWIDIHDDLYWLKKGEYFTWISERDGWRHVYRISRDGKNIRPITAGSYDVIDVLKVDENKGWLYYIASPQNPGQRYLFRAPLWRTGKPQRLSPIRQPGTHRYQVSSSGRWAIHTYSTFDSPPVTDLVRLPDHKRVRLLVENGQLRERVNRLKRSPGEFFRVDIGGGVMLDGWCIKPADFDHQKNYPVLFYVYGEPWAQTVLDRWRGNTYLWHLLLAQKGYVVISVDNRGTPAPRGRHFRKCIYRQIGILNSHDQAAAVRTILKQRSYLDPQRVGVWGWSAGGTMTLNCLFRYPELYAAGMAVAPVANQRYYDSIYQERYMGLPQENPDGYREGSPITHAQGLKGNLLIVHGTGDDNVHYQNTEALVNELVKHKKTFDMMSYPNRSHGIYEEENTTRHLYGLLFRYLTTHMPPHPE
jgi:dipeptidyl-peptidase-4